MAPVLVNGSPKLPRLPMPSALDHESFDITLHRKDTEGFGFVILTSKSKPPHGGESLVSQILHQMFKSFIICVLSLTQCGFEKFLICRWDLMFLVLLRVYNVWYITSAKWMSQH